MGGLVANDSRQTAAFGSRKEGMGMIRVKAWKTACLVIVLALALGPGAGAQVLDAEDDEPIRQNPNPMNVTTDLLLLRPIGLVMIPVTAILYVISYPFAKASGSEEETYQSLVGDTIKYTFERPLGEGAPFE